MEQSEIDLLTGYLRTLFDDEDILVVAHPEDDQKAIVAQDQEMFGRIERDDDEGEISYAFIKDVPDAPVEELTELFQTLFNTRAVQVKARPKTSDSTEVYKGEEFVGVLYDDDETPDGVQVFNMAILDIDLHGYDESDENGDAA